MQTCLKNAVTLVVGWTAIASFSKNLQAEPLLTIPTVDVGNPGNADASAANTTSGQSGAYGYGGVDYDFEIGTTEVTINQYVTFLNAVATSPSASFGIATLWKSAMQDSANVLAISRTTVNGLYNYQVIGDGTRPISMINWYDAARFANWMNNGATVGASTETGAYNLNGATSGIFNRQPGATWFIPNENEWYKAAYYDPTMFGGTGGYHLFANQSDVMSSHELGVPGAANYSYPNAAGGSAPRINVYQGTVVKVSPTEAYDTISYYGTYDQTGNVAEWTETINGLAPVPRGGGWSYLVDTTSAAFHDSLASGSYSTGSGFRLATIPEPSAGGLLLLAMVSLAGARKRLRSR